MSKRIGGLVLVLAMTAAACGPESGTGLATLDDPAAAETGGTAESPTGDDPAAEMTNEEAMFALAECIRDQGFDVQDPVIGDDGFPRLRSMFQPLMEGGEVDRAAMGVAMEACAEFADAITTEFRDLDSTDREDQMFAYAECMRDNGYDMPDPDFSGEPGQGQGGGPFGGSIDREDPDFQAAQEVCRDLFVGGGPGGGPGGGAPPPGA